MRNNLQAISIQKLNSINFNRYIQSEDIYLDKKKFKKIKNGSWLNIETVKIDANCFENGKNRCSIKLTPNGEYLYAKVTNIVKKYSKCKKECFNLRVKIDYIPHNSQFIIDKFPMSAVMYRGTKEFAYVNLYFNGTFVLEVKELL